jgi:nucleotidyltransferase/DNA polymerase involved in DNA repair
MPSSLHQTIIAPVIGKQPIPVGDVWGVGRQITATEKLLSMNIDTIQDLRIANS